MVASTQAIASSSRLNGAARRSTSNWRGPVPTAAPPVFAAAAEPAARPARAVATTSSTGRGDVHDDAGFVRVERFQRGELGIQQGGRHEVAGAALQPVAQDVLAPVQVQEDGLGCQGADGVPVAALERRAGQDESSLPGVAPACCPPWRARASGHHQSAACRQPFWRRSPPGGGSRRRGTRTPSSRAMRSPMVVLPQPETPMTTTCGAGRSFGSKSLFITSRGPFRRRGGCRAGRPAGRGTPRRLLR